MEPSDCSLPLEPLPQPARTDPSRPRDPALTEPRVRQPRDPDLPELHVRQRRGRARPWPPVLQPRAPALPEPLVPPPRAPALPEPLVPQRRALPGLLLPALFPLAPPPPELFRPALPPALALPERLLLPVPSRPELQPLSPCRPRPAPALPERPLLPVPSQPEPRPLSRCRPRSAHEPASQTRHRPGPYRPPLERLRSRYPQPLWLSLSAAPARSCLLCWQRPYGNREIPRLRRPEPVPCRRESPTMAYWRSVELRFHLPVNRSHPLAPFQRALLLSGSPTRGLSSHRAYAGPTA